MSHLEEYMEKLSTMPNDVNRLLRLIRFLDKKVDAIQHSLSIQQKKFENKVKDLKERKIAQCPPEMKAEYESIVAKQMELYGYAKQKQMVASQLFFQIRESEEQIKNQLKNKLKDRPTTDEQGANPQKKKKKIMENPGNKPPPKQEQYLYDNNDQKYCYCLQGSFGEMVGCENPYCEKQWFHLSCVDEKTVSGASDWYCSDCTKLRERFKKPTIRQFL